MVGRWGRELRLAGCLVANLELGKMLLEVAVGRRWSTIASGWGAGRREKDGEYLFEGKPVLRRVVVGCCCLLVPALLRRSTDSAG